MGRLLNGREAASYLGVSRMTWYTRIADELPGYLIGKRVYYRRQDIDVWVDRQRIEPRAA